MISRQDFFVLFQFISTNDSTKGATGATAIVPEFLDALTHSALMSRLAKYSET